MDNLEERIREENTSDVEAKDSSVVNAINLFSFLRELKRFNTKLVRTLDEYHKEKGDILWLNDIPERPECYCMAWDDEVDGETWLRVNQPDPRVTPPAYPEVIESWVNHKSWNDASSDYPELYSQIIVEIDTNEEISENDPDEQLPLLGLSHELEEQDGEQQDLPFSDSTVIEEQDVPQVQLIEDYPEIEEAWDHYVKNCWKPWQAAEKNRLQVQETYAKLFTIHQSNQQLGEQYELVLSFGLLTRKTKSGHRIKRHLVTRSASIDFDSHQGVIRVGLPIDGGTFRLEYTDMMDADECPLRKSVQPLDNSLSNMGEELWPKDQISVVLTSFAHLLSPDGRYSDSISRPKNPSDDVLVTFAPALILRPRGERSFITAFDSIVDQLNESLKIPSGLGPLVNDGSRDRPSNETNDDSLKINSLQDHEIYFPLPANEQQRRILGLLRHNEQILIQGPPGTGKSHTIVNLMCHLLASGNRVLVTSHAARALQVLKKKMKDAPGDISQLCIELLDSGLESNRLLEESVRGITNKRNSWDEKDSAESISRLEEEIHENKKREASLYKKIRDIREKETIQHSRLFGRFNGTAQNIAVHVEKESNLYKWVHNSEIAQETPPLSDDEALSLASLLRKRDADLNQINGCEIPPLEAFIKPEEFNNLVSKHTHSDQQWHAVKGLEGAEEFKLLLSAKNSTREDLSLTLNRIADTLDRLSKHRLSYGYNAALDILGERDRSWRNLLVSTNEILDETEPVYDQIKNAHFSNLDEVDPVVLEHDISIILEHIASGKTLRLWALKPKAIKDIRYITQDFLVNGGKCDSVESLEMLRNKAFVLKQVNRLEAMWAPITKVPSGSILTALADYRDIAEPLEVALNLHKDMLEAQSLLSLIPEISEPTWHSKDELCRLRDISDAVGKQITLVEAEKLIASSALNPYAKEEKIHPAVKLLEQAINARDGEMYSKTYSDLNQCHESLKRLNECKILSAKLKVASRSAWSAFENAVIEMNESFTGDYFSKSWSWALAKNWLSSLADPNEYNRLAKRIEETRTIILNDTGELAAEKAWKSCIGRLTDKEKRHLISWMQSINLIGKGTGRHAPKRIAQAREEMSQCRTAIPAWVMPLYRVVETVEMKPNIFDVVIIDEASQSGPEAMICQFIGKKVLVVGDDKQIRPSNVGANEDIVEKLRQDLIPDIPHSKDYDLKHSYYDHTLRACGASVRLREHFRCMPEIIQFSSNLCYEGEPLIPMREYGTDRISPSVTTSYVTNGYQEGKSSSAINQAEAEAIVSKIEELIDDPAYDGKTMGVISLQGNQQASLIEKLCLEKINVDDIGERRLRFGDAYAFQGDERDVIFLSMVVARQEGVRFAAQTTEPAMQRYNVSASRAKDQLWLFHSVDVNDLSPKDLRYKLLEYCLNPNVRQEMVGDHALSYFRKAFSERNHAKEKSPRPFDSWFEMEVFFKIHDKGYRVVPQYEVGEFRIDLVVQGLKGRLAVECDGDYWHGPAQYEHDMGRQRDLERCGWTFWRLRESSFRLNKDRALEGLWEALSELGIHSSIQDEAKSDEFENHTHSEAKKDERAPVKKKEPAKKKVSEVEELRKKPAVQEGLELPLSKLRQIIFEVMKERPNQTCKLDGVSKEVLAKLNIITRGKPREQFDKRVKQAIDTMVRKGTLKRYRTSKNERVKLLS